MNTLKFKIRTDKKRNLLFYDFLIDGKSLYDMCQMEDYDQITPFGWDVNLEEEKKMIQQFLGNKRNEELESGRVKVFVCAECGDIGCGATTIEISEKQDEIIWSNFGDENNYEKEIDFFNYTDIGPFKFEKIAYKKSFNELLQAITVYSKK
ncbi:hypothetical protein [Kordia sp.]|uniref:hypothetical protein n=1 Tax=Kordia sp. TaxID=1965332 RepID=UPI0025C53432|nr:hypothetical protein [Kordia sp.]MCH2192928.1 hypothetical protein [Kordia sp.]